MSGGNDSLTRGESPAGEDQRAELTPASEPAPSGSFIAEASFSRAPLNSRLPPISPHRVTIAAARAADQSRDEDGELTYAEEDSEEEEVRETETRVGEGLEKEELGGLAAELQEALVVEDLLFVLMVRFASLEMELELTVYAGHRGTVHRVRPLLLSRGRVRAPARCSVCDRSQHRCVPSPPPSPHQPNLPADPWLSSVISRLLPLATYYTSIHAFVEQYSLLEHGVINHALCAALREMLRVGGSSLPLATLC